MRHSPDLQSCKASLTLLWIAGFIVCFSGNLRAQETASVSETPAEKYGEWDYKEDADGNQIREMRLRVYPASEPVPAFKHRLIPAAKDRVEGNSALFYLKAMGFFEQSNAREQLTKLERKWSEDRAKKIRDDWPPSTWRSTPPESLPMEQVKQYLDLHSFQPEFLYDAARRTRFEHDRAMDRERSPLNYLLPSIQGHRQLARVQTIRCRFAIAEGRIDDAIEIVGQMMALGQHLGSDEFLVSGLVGVACHNIGIDEGFMLSQQPDTPNLYWAIAACPDPPIDFSRAMAWEQEFLFHEFPILKEVTEEALPPVFWIDFMRRFEKKWHESMNEYRKNYTQEKVVERSDSFRLANAVARDYPVARDFLHDVYRLPDEQLDKYPKAQIVFLAIVKYYEFTQNQGLKQFVTPFASRPKKAPDEFVEHLRWRFNWDSEAPDLGDSLLPIGDMFVPATETVLAAAARAEQMRNLWQTVEAIRMTAAENGGTLPASLDQLVVPAPLDPGTNRPFEYELNGEVATLRSEKLSRNYRWQIKLELAKPAPQQEENK